MMQVSVNGDEKRANDMTALAIPQPVVESRERLKNGSQPWCTTAVRYEPASLAAGCFGATHKSDARLPHFAERFCELLCPP